MHLLKSYTVQKAYNGWRGGGNSGFRHPAGEEGLGYFCIPKEEEEEVPVHKCSASLSLCPRGAVGREEPPPLSGHRFEPRLLPLFFSMWLTPALPLIPGLCPCVHCTSELPCAHTSICRAPRSLHSALRAMAPFLGACSTGGHVPQVAHTHQVGMCQATKSSGPFQCTCTTIRAAIQAALLTP